MRFLPESFQRVSQRLLKRRSKRTSGGRKSKEEQDAKGWKELEATIAENADFLLLKGEKLHTYENRMKELAKILTRSQPLPDFLAFEASRSRGFQSTEEIDANSNGAGPSRSLDSAQDLIKSHHSSQEQCSEYTNSMRNIRAWTQDEDSEIIEEITDTNTMDLTPVHRNGRSQSDIYDEEHSSEELRSIPLGMEDLPANLLQGSVHKDVLTSEITPRDNLSLFAEMNDWSRMAAGAYSFADDNSHLPMKMHSFIPLETQMVSYSIDDTAPQKTKLPQIEDSFSSTEGLLFAFSEAEVRGEHEICSTQKSVSSDLTAGTSQTEIEASGALILDKIRNKTSSTGRSCTFAHVTAVSDYPSNVWEDIAPTRLNSSVTTLSMDSC